jgi:hypothetical protein
MEEALRASRPGAGAEPRASDGWGSAPRFQFERDTFTFANELVWEYRLDSATSRMTVVPSDPPPTYWHRCFVMVRSVRQFFYHARFDPARPQAEPAAYRRLICEVVGRSPRRVSADAERVVIPGYDCLRAFSQAQAPLLKANCGGAWQSYVLRSHWRMVFPIWRGQQEQMARQLVRSLRGRPPPIVHLFRFPRITINHGVVLFGAAESDGEIEFEVYDPNIPAHPVKLIYQRSARTFTFPATHYWAGGPVSVIEIYRRWPY